MFKIALTLFLVIRSFSTALRSYLFYLFIHLLNKTEYAAFLQLLELKTQLSETDQIKYPASAQLTHKCTAFLQLFEKMYSFSAGLKRNAPFLQLFKRYINS